MSVQSVFEGVQGRGTDDLLRQTVPVVDDPLRKGIYPHVFCRFVFRYALVVATCLLNT